MRKHFFCAKNIEDYRKVYKDIMLAEKTADETQEDFDQRFFLSQIKSLFQVPQDVFDSMIYGETGIDGLRLDFNFGLRLDVPEGNFRVVIGDADTDEIFFDKYISGGRILSVEQYFIRWHVKIFLNGAKVFEHTLNLEGQKVMLAFRQSGLGDLIALLPFAREFKRFHRCELSICLPDYVCELAANLYPEIPQADEINFKTYATHYPAMMAADCLTVPIDIRNVPMERVGGAVLGLATLPEKPTFKPTTQRFCTAPYVCIGVQASSARKSWLYPGGWDIVVNYLKSLGWRVFCIDKKSIETSDGMTICKPDGAEDFTGDIPIMERANMLYHAEFFIGLSSGLAWLADAVNCPVVMIAAFTHDWHEFYTPYRVANRLVCNACYSDIRVCAFNNFCPYHKGTARELECQKKIHPRQVINAIERLIIDRNLIPPIMRN
jgi:autotransporter strand-loop-strand O-heptosyltransferase